MLVIPETEARPQPKEEGADRVTVLQPLPLPGDWRRRNLTLAKIKNSTWLGFCQPCSLCGKLRGARGDRKGQSLGGKQNQRTKPAATAMEYPCLDRQFVDRRAGIVARSIFRFGSLTHPAFVMQLWLGVTTQDSRPACSSLQ
jgi:hypothetical protein